MTSKNEISPLRIANEAFMVAATIERCPRQMMLRELVMNALEAASAATDAPKMVKIDAVMIEGTPKLRIWNTGRGLSRPELLQISDLSSSLFKTVSLDGNFGMGAKAASLASNKLGLRYRSCRLGEVSQIMLGAREGVYGRLLQNDEEGESREAVDVTRSATVAGEDLSHDWTEVTLFGNSPEQDTAADPYAGNPVMPRDWVAQTLGRRYVRLPVGVKLVIEPSASGKATAEIFTPSLTASSFDHFEAVETEGVVIHYGYRAKESPRPMPRAPIVGVGAVVYDGEIYALTDERRWALEAPTYGLTFAAKQCSVVVELPHSFGGRPEQYRQFLRFTDGDQRQVQFADFGDLVRRNMPGWLKRIVASLLPAQGDHLAEIGDEMRDLLAELGIEDLLRNLATPEPSVPNSENPPQAKTPPERSDPPKPPPPSPPEIIVVENEADIVEKALGGRAARYYPATRQVFVNARYSALARLEAQLADEFAPFADEETIKRLAKLTAEWAIIQRIARNLLYSIGKLKADWSADEIKTVQSPETMSLMVDDIDPMLAPARRRMAGRLGLEAPSGELAGLGGDPLARRAASELAEAEAHLQRAMGGNRRDLGRFYRQIGAIHLRQRNVEAARAWLRKGMAAEPGDPWCRYDYAGLLLAENDLDGAAVAADEALARAGENRTPFLRRRAEVEVRRGNHRQAEALLSEGLRQEPENAWLHYDLAGLHIATGDFASAAAAAAVAIERAPTPSAALVRRQAEVELRRGDRDAARKLYTQALALDPNDPWTLLALAGLDRAQGRPDEAIARLEAALALHSPAQARIHRAISEAEMQRGRLAAALAAAQRAVRADTADIWSRLQLAGVLRAIGDLKQAAAVAAEAVELAPTLPAAHRRLGEIEGALGNPAAALKHLDFAANLAPDDPWTWIMISAQRLALKDLEGADAAAETAQAKLMDEHRARALRQRAQIALYRRDTPSAHAFLREAMEVAPCDPWTRFDAAHLLFTEGDYEAAAEQAQQSLNVSPAPHPAILVRAAVIAERRGRLETARNYLQQAIVIAPHDPQPWSKLANILIAAGDLAGAREAAEKAVSVATRGLEAAS